MRGDRWRDRAPILAGLALLIGALLALQVGYPESGLLYLAPALLLLGALAFDRHPGERLLDALARVWHPVLDRAGRTPAPSLLSPCTLPRGSVLLAMALAGRGPPS